jgi:hypothetical protein
MSVETDLLAEMLAVLPGVTADGLALHKNGGLPSVFPVSELATAAVSAAALAAARYTGADRVTVDRELASAWFGTTLTPIGWELPSVWDAIAGDYRSLDGWIRLHTNAPHHRAAALAVLGVDADRDAVASAVETWRGADLDTAVVSAGGCAAVMHSPDEWAWSEPGTAVSQEPLIDWTDLSAGRADLPHLAARKVVAGPEASTDPHTRPLAGVRVLDLTRVLAGPVATRFLALLGADVLRVDPPGWEEAVIPDVNLGKRATRLNLHTPGDRRTFTALLERADVVVSGYRPGALERLGFGTDERQRRRPGLIDVALDAYGWTGPLAGRRGFDSLVQMSSGIAHTGMTRSGADKPVPLPVQALDHATGYLMAAATLSALAHRRETTVGRSARLSLARTAQLLLARPGEGRHTPFVDRAADVAGIEKTTWGPAHRLRPPFEIDGVSLEASPARALGLDQPVWR